MSDVTVNDAPAAHRYEALTEGSVAGFAAYRLSDGVVTFTHTEVDPALEGHGVGTVLARAALDDARSRGLAVVPLCPFIASWIERHPDYADLLRD
ncbi:MAG: N-acetyltransferase [Actinomycetota bacterium]|nr:N-acetyltransferase [Actinomycetota bacterium]